jgi:hypothetical protein
MKNQKGWGFLFFVLLLALFIAPLAHAIDKGEIKKKKLIVQSGSIPVGNVPVVLRPGVYGDSGKAASEIGGGAVTGKVDEVDGVATNLTVPNLIYTASAFGTNYIFATYIDATNDVMRIDKAVAP